MEIWTPEPEPNGYCSVCDCDLFGDVESMQRHMAACVRRNIDEIRAQAPSQQFKDTVFDPNTWNPEVEEYLAGVGERMLAEGRLEMLPSERVENE